MEGEPGRPKRLGDQTKPSFGGDGGQRGPNWRPAAHQGQIWGIRPRENGSNARDKNGRYVPVVDAPQEKLPKGWISKEEHERALREVKSKVAPVEKPNLVGAAKVEAADTEVMFKANGDAPSLEDGFRSTSSDELDVYEGFPDLAPTKPAKGVRMSQPDRGEEVSWLRSPFRDLLGNIEGALSLFVKEASAQEPVEHMIETPSVGAQAFDSMLEDIARGAQRIRDGVNKRARELEQESDQSLDGEDCTPCRLDTADFERAERAARTLREKAHADDAYSAKETGEVPTPHEAEAIETALRMSFTSDPKQRSNAIAQMRALDDILKIIGDPGDPASIIAILEKALEENPRIRDYVPDIDERLGLDEPDPALEDPTGTGTLIFVSRSLGEKELLELFERNAGKEDVTLVFRGVPKDVKFLDGVTEIQRLASQFDPMPNVVLDPTLFRDFGITRVPTVMRIRERTPLVLPQGSNKRKLPEMIAKATGLHADHWVKEQIERGLTGDLGEQGESREISEPDLIEVMKQRALAIDWEKKKDEAAKRAWVNLPYETLPTVENSCTRIVDPTILVAKDITDINGNYIRKAGERINPLDLRPFNSALIVFNPLVEEELKVAEAAYGELRRHHSNVMLLATDMVKDETGWDAYKKLTDRLDSHVFLLTKDVRERWEIRATPSVVVADNERKHFVVYEMAPSTVLASEDGDDVWPWNPFTPTKEK